MLEHSKASPQFISKLKEKKMADKDCEASCISAARDSANISRQQLEKQETNFPMSCFLNNCCVNAQTNGKMENVNDGGLVVLPQR